MFARSVTLRYASRYLPLLTLALLLLPLRLYWAGKIQQYSPNTSSTSSPFRAGSALYSVALLSPNNVWAAGGTFIQRCGQQQVKTTCFATPVSGTILHYTDTTWIVAGSATEPLLSIALDSPTDGWAVGYTGTFLHFDGKTWSLIPAPTKFNQSLFSVVMLSASDGWAVGNSGSILHYDGQQWTAVSSSVTVDLRSIAMSSPQEGWAVGVNGTILHYLHGTWSITPSPTRNALNTVTMLSSTEGWAVGDAGTILHYRAEDGTWETVYRDPSVDPSTNLYSISLNTVRAGWIVGQHQLLNYSSEVWTETATIPIHTPIKDAQSATATFYMLNLYSIALAHSGEGWAVGSTDDNGPNNIVILHYINNMWSVSFTTS